MLGGSSFIDCFCSDSGSGFGSDSGSGSDFGSGFGSDFYSDYSLFYLHCCAVSRNYIICGLLGFILCFKNE